MDMPLLARRLLALALVLATLATSAVAQAAEPFFDARTLDLTRFLPSPPADDSAQTRRDITELLAIQATRTPEMVDRASADIVEDVWRFASALPPDLQTRFNATALPLLAALSDRIRATKSAVNDPAKTFWNRPRPYLLSADVRPGIQLEKTPSWPSGHTTYAWAMAIVLADMLPGYRSALFRRADEFARNRVIGGVHYPSDIVAGRLAGALIAAELQHDAAFLAQDERARTEVRAVLMP